MVKSIIKELLIMILLVAAIILVLGILLYDYMPNNKIVPVASEYETSESIKQEINEKVAESKQEVIVTYEVDAGDLNSYKKTKDYNAGNPDPFSYYSSGTASNNGTNTSTGNNTGSTNTSNTGASTNVSGGTFYDNRGTK